MENAKKTKKKADAKLAPKPKKASKPVKAKKEPAKKKGPTNKELASLAASSAAECYGVIGMAPRPQIRDVLPGALKALAPEDAFKGVYVYRNLFGAREVGLYLYVAYGCKITEVTNEVQKRVKYELERKFGEKIAAVNVYVMDVKEA